MVDEQDRRPEGGDEGEDYSKKVSTVEVLDNRVVIVPPSQWFLLGTLLAVVLFIVIWSIAGELTTRVEGWGIISSEGSQLLSIDAPRHGIVKQVLVEAGSFVQEGDELLEVLEASTIATRNFKLHLVRAPLAARVIAVTTEAGRHLEAGQVLLRLQSPGTAPLGHLWLPFQIWQQVRVGQRALLHVAGLQALAGRIIKVTDNPQPRHKILLRWGDGVLLPPGKIFYRATCALDRPLAANPERPGYSWLLPNKAQINTGTQRRFSVTVERYSPLSLVMPWLGVVKR